MYSFIDADKNQVDIKPENVDQSLKMADDFRNWKIDNNEHKTFHENRRMYWEDFYTKLSKLKNN